MRRTARRTAPAALGAAILALLGVAMAQGRIAMAQGRIEVDPTEAIGEVGPYVYGVNYGPLSAVPVHLFDEAAALGLDFVRFPGGAVGDRDDLRPFDLQQLMSMAEILGAEPSVQARLAGGTPEKAAALVSYANVEEGYGIRHWYVGNEPSLYDDYDVATYNREWRATAEAMLAVDPSIVLIGPEPHQWTGLAGDDPLDPNGADWLRGFLEANGDLVDVVAVHRYPFPEVTGVPDTTAADLRANAEEWKHLITRLRTVSEEVTGRTDLRFAVTEANSHWSATTDGEATNDSHMNAVWWADVLGKLIVDGAYIVGYFDLQSSPARGGFGLLTNSAPRPTYYVYSLYARFGSNLVQAGSTVPHVSAYAALRGDGALTVILTNLADAAVRAPFDLVAGGDYGVATGWLLDEERSADPITSPLDADGTVSLPGRSVTLIELREAEAGTRAGEEELP